MHGSLLASEPRAELRACDVGGNVVSAVRDRPA